MRNRRDGQACAPGGYPHSCVTHDFPASFEHILRVLPRTTTIAIVNGASPNENFWLGELKRETAHLSGRVKLKFYNEMSFEDILKDAANLPPHSAIFWHLMNVDAAGVAHETNVALSKLSAAANAPVFSYLDNFFGDSTTVGGPMHSIAEGSEVAAAVAIRILKGEKAGDIKTPPTRYASPKYDWRQMQRWGISESDLPPGSTVLFKPPSPRETYRWPILSICTVLLLQGGLIILLMLERHRRQSAEMDARQRMMELAHVNRLSTAGEMAAGIAHEINQPLGAILNNTETAKILLESRAPDMKQIKEIVDDIQRDNGRASDVVRSLRSFIKKVPLGKKAIDINDQVAETLKFLAPEARSRAIVLRSKMNGAPLRISGDPIQLQQVFSNLILNGFDAASDATEAEKAVTVTTTRNGRFAEISVADTGTGVSEEAAKKIFDPFYSTKDHGMGMGLSIVRTIVEAYHGHIEIGDRNGANGAVFRDKLPLASARSSPLSRTGIHALKVGGAHLLPPPAREASGGEGRLGQSPSGVGGASPRRFVDDRARVSMAALAQPPHHSRLPPASPSHPAPLPLPAARLRRAGGGRSEKLTWVNLIALQETFAKGEIRRRFAASRCAGSRIAFHFASLRCRRPGKRG